MWEKRWSGTISRQWRVFITEELSDFITEGAKEQDLLFIEKIKQSMVTFALITEKNALGLCCKADQQELLI